MNRVKNGFRRYVPRLPAMALGMLLPMLCGCPDKLSDAIATAMETATRDIADSALDIFFDQFQDEALR